MVSRTASPRARCPNSENSRKSFGRLEFRQEKNVKNNRSEFEQFGNHAICSISALIFCCVELYREIPSLSITISSDIPLGAGLGSSAALSTALSATILIDSQTIQVDPNNVQNHQFSDTDLQTINSLSRSVFEFT